MSGGSTTTTTNEPWAEQKPFLLGGFDEAKRLYEKGMPGYYPGATVAGFDPAQQAAHQATLGYAMGPRAAAQQAGAENQLLGTYGLSRNLAGMGARAGRYGQSLARPLSQSQFSRLTPFKQKQYRDLMAGNVNLGPRSPFKSTADALTQSVMGNLKGNILPGLRQQQMQYQPGGSSRGQLEQNKAISSAVASGLTKPMAQMYSDAYQQAQGMRLPAAQMGLGAQQHGMGYGLQGLGAAQGAGQLGLGATAQYPGMMNAPFSLYDRMAGVGRDRQALNQRQINADMQRYNYEANAPRNALNQFMNTISGNYGGTQTSTGGGGGDIMSLIGTLGSAAIMASDVRVKENIKPSGTIRGHNAYTFNYLGDSNRRRGVIAQEVERTNPSAVAEFGGIKHVNYGLL